MDRLLNDCRAKIGALERQGMLRDMAQQAVATYFYRAVRLNPLDPDPKAVTFYYQKTA